MSGERERLVRGHFEQGWEFAHLISERIALRSFLVSEMSNSFTSLISSEQPEQIAHGRSFPLSDLRDLLTVAHFS